MNVKNKEIYLKRNIVCMERILNDFINFLNENKNFKILLYKKYKISEDFLLSMIEKIVDIINAIPNLMKYSGNDFFRYARNFLLNDYNIFVTILNNLFNQIVIDTEKKNIFEFISTTNDKEWKKINGYFLLLTSNFKELKNLINQFFFKDITLKDELIVNNDTILWDITGMEYKEFHSDILKIRNYAKEVTKMMVNKINKSDYFLLEQQVSEIIKNAIRHGNQRDINKLACVWYQFNGNIIK